MAIEIPGKRFGKRLRKSRVFGGGVPGKKSINSDLLITPLVDMFVILVLFLIANFSATGEILQMSKDIQLPSAQHALELEIAPVVTITNDEVLCDGQPIGRVQDLIRDEYLNIQALEDKMRDLKRKFEDLRSAANLNEEFKGNVNIQGHKEVKFNIVKRVMFSCASAGYGNINFAVLNTGGDQGGAKAAAATP